MQLGVFPTLSLAGRAYDVIVISHVSTNEEELACCRLPTEKTLMAVLGKAVAPHQCPSRFNYMPVGLCLVPDKESEPRRSNNILVVGRRWWKERKRKRIEAVDLG